jgi:hypothetical protein
MLSCVTTTVLIRRTSGTEPAIRRAELARTPTPLRGTTPFALQFSLIYAVQPEPDASGWRVDSLGYRYELYDDDTELLAYHWHPFGRSSVVAPHVHITNRHPSLDLAKAHLPTGIVSPAAFLRCLIAELGVEPLRSDWQAVFADER